jgi:hypothetical protein
MQHIKFILQKYIIKDVVRNIICKYTNYVGILIPFKSLLKPSWSSKYGKRFYICNDELIDYSYNKIARLKPYPTEILKFNSKCIYYESNYRVYKYDISSSHNKEIPVFKHSGMFHYAMTNTILYVINGYEQLGDYCTIVIEAYDIATLKKINEMEYQVAVSSKTLFNYFSKCRATDNFIIIDNFEFLTKLCLRSGRYTKMNRGTSNRLYYNDHMFEKINDEIHITDLKNFKLTTKILWSDYIVTIEIYDDVICIQGYYDAHLFVL